jgi:hypothetical protein
MFKGKKCKRCEGKIKVSYDFCPYCGLDITNPEKDVDDFGMLGKSNQLGGFPLVGGQGGFGMTDKMINSIMKSLMRNLEKQMKSLDPEVQTSPGGIKIKFGIPQDEKKVKKEKRRVITEEQVERMSQLPRGEAKTNVRRLSDKIIYELKTNGISSVDDVFVSKLENGYEVKAIGKKKVYVNSIPVNLPLKGYSVSDIGLKVEFGFQ